MGSRKIVHVVSLVVAVGLVSACNSDSAGNGGVGNPQLGVGATPTPVSPTGGQKVKDGPAPLQYMFAAGGNVRVMDATTGKQVARAEVEPNTMLRVDQKAGVRAGDKELVRGPLPANHEYEIWLDR
jgi:hypothetical protein